jgi:hypothetical protein
MITVITPKTGKRYVIDLFYIFTEIFIDFIDIEKRLSYAFILMLKVIYSHVKIHYISFSSFCKLTRDQKS